MFELWIANELFCTAPYIGTEEGVLALLTNAIDHGELDASALTDRHIHIIYKEAQATNEIE